MPEWTYVPGQLPVIVGKSISVLLAGERAESTARRIMNTARTAGDIATVVDEILSDGGVRNAPSFFIGEVIDGTLHCLVRGALAVNIESSSGEVSQLTATRNQTWAEFHIDSFARFWVSAFSDPPAPQRRAARPGPLAVSSLVFDLAGTTESASSAQTIAPATYREVTANKEITAVAEQTPDILTPVGSETPESVTPSKPSSSYDSLFGDVTMVGSIEVAAVRDEVVTSATDSASILDSDFDTSTSAISAILCNSNHANPPERAECWKCSSPLVSGKVVRINRPALGQLLFDNGRTVRIDRTILVGRSPRADRTDASGIPQLVMVDSPHGDVSRTHARIFIEGWRVLIEDLGSTNGTVITNQAGVSRRIRSHEPAIVTHGSTIDLGDGAVFRAVDVP